MKTIRLFIFCLVAITSFSSLCFGYVDIVTTDKDGVWVFNGSEAADYSEGTFYFIGTGVEPWHLAKADLNGDGLVDIISSNRYGPSVSVLLNNGDGFNDPVQYDAGPKPYCTAAADFDGDGDIDLAVANPVSGGVLVLLKNNGAGEFTTMDELYLGNKTYGLAACDLNLDKKMDLIILNEGDDEAIILKGNGDGTFAEGVHLSTGNSPKSVATGNFNNDSLPDFAVANYDSASVSIFINDGDSFFETGRTYAAGIQPRHLVAHDLDGDALDDLVVVGGRGSEDVYVLFGEGDDAFTSADIYHTGPRPNSVAVDDIDGDGELDILAANWSLGNEALASVTILGGRGDRKFETLLDFKPEGGFKKITFLLTGEFRGVVFVRGDVNGDGKITIADPVLCLRYMFGFNTIDCVDAADVNDRGDVNIADAVLLLSYLFIEGPPPKPPFPNPGPDPTDDLLSCGI